MKTSKYTSPARHPSAHDGDCILRMTSRRPGRGSTCAEFNVERLRPYLRRPDHLSCVAVPPPLVVGAYGRQGNEPSMRCRSSSSKCSGGCIRAGALGGARSVGRHAGTARKPDQLQGGHLHPRAGHRPLSVPPRPATAGRLHSSPPRSHRQASQWSSRHRATFVQRQWDGQFSTGAEDGGSAAPSPAYAA